MNYNELRRLLIAYAESKGFPEVDPVGVLHAPDQYRKFNPSAGHRIYPVIREKIPHKPENFSMIERCLREADVSKIGVSNRHLSFFEMFVFTTCGDAAKLPIRKNTEDFCGLMLDYLKLDPNKILVTVLEEYQMDNMKITTAETSEVYISWKNILGEERVKLVKGHRNFFLSRIPNVPGGTGAEIYYQTPQGDYIEIGSQLYYHYLYYGQGQIKQMPNANFGNGLGIERLLIALEGKNNVYDISLFQPAKTLIIDSMNDGTENIFRENIDIMIDAVRTISFSIIEKYKKNIEFSESQEKILKKFKKEIMNQCEYLGIGRESDFFERLFEKVTLPYAEHYKSYKEYDIKEIFLQFLS